MLFSIFGLSLEIAPTTGMAECFPVDNMAFVRSGDVLVASQAASDVAMSFANPNFTSTGYAWWSSWSIGPMSGNYNYVVDGQSEPGHPLTATQLSGGGVEIDLPSESTWQSGHVYVANDILVKNGRVFWAYQGGTSGTTEPNWSNTSLATTWNSVPGGADTIIDGGVTWIYRGAASVPLVQLCDYFSPVLPSSRLL